MEIISIYVVVPPWSNSLATSLIPSTRTCSDAYIPSEYCACSYNQKNWKCAYDNEEGSHEISSLILRMFLLYEVLQFKK